MVKKRVNNFLKKKPGSRFIYLHKLFVKSEKKVISSVSRYSIGLMLLLAGLGMLVLPGPGILTILVGLALIGLGSEDFAHFLDKLDKKFHQKKPKKK